MNSKHKIINDPVYGFITISNHLIYDIIAHRFFQRLRRISQLGLSHYVYPGAVNTRFHHALGAYHLSRQTVHSLRNKNVDISDEEAMALQIGILLHDIGHGPYSHSLEQKIIPFHHEELSLKMMEIMNTEMDGALTLAITIFKNQYHRPFFYQLISGQLDMDRMDYLSRDSYFTGVAEGVIAYDRIIKMMNVVDDQLVIEIKGIYSVEKFLLARRLMYWQVYLHKAVLSADKMLQLIITSYLEDIQSTIPSPLKDIHSQFSHAQVLHNEIIDEFSFIDDTEVNFLIKQLAHKGSVTTQYLANALLNRDLFKMLLSKTPIKKSKVKDIKSELQKSGFDTHMIETLVMTGMESNSYYDINAEEINILLKDGSVQLFSSIIEQPIQQVPTVRYYVAYPRLNS